MGFPVVPLSELSNDSAEKFRKIYQHMSPNSYDYEIFCYLRYFYLLNYLRREKADSVWSLDSDVLLYSSVEELGRLYPGALSTCGIMIPEQDMSEPYGWACAHVSHWTIEWLEDFCNYILSVFSEEKYIELNREWSEKGHEWGGVSDMITLWMYRIERGESVVNLAPGRAGAAIDDNFNSPSSYKADEFEFIAGRKQVYWKRNQPYFKKADGSNELVRVHAIHFQGAAKSSIPEAYSGTWFPGKISLDLDHRVGAVKRYSKELARRLVSHGK